MGQFFVDFRAVGIILAPLGAILEIFGAQLRQAPGPFLLLAALLGI